MSVTCKEPKLRFKEFSEEWELKPLSKVTKMKAGKFAKASNISDTQKNEMYPCYGGNGLRGYVATKTHEGTYALIGRQGALCGNVQLASGKFHATEHAVVVTPINGNDTLWLYYELGRLNLNRFATGQAQPGLSVEVIQQVKTNIPQKPEQEKIASFLSAVDSRIEQLTKKEQLLCEYKKGVMQKIFSQELRFKDDDGSAFPEWEEKKLGEIGTFKSGLGFTELEQGGKLGVPFFKVSDMNIKENKKIMVTANNYVNDEQISRLQYKPINEYAIIFAKVGAAIFLERKRIAHNFLIDNNMMAFIAHEDIYFIQQLFDTIRLSKYAQVGALPSYNASDLKTIKVKLPSLKEQTKIANFLSSIDKKIEQTAKELNLTKEFKKGLLQQMFV